MVISTTVVRSVFIVIKGDTPHFDYVCNAVTDGVGQLALKFSKPCIFGRLTAWQNWIFQRPNAVGEKGALKVYGKGEKVQFDMNRV